MKQVFAGLILVVSGATPCLAHEFWLEPLDWQVEPGASVQLALMFGDGMPGESYPRNPNHMTRFELIGSGAARSVPGRIGADPAGAARVGSAGVHVGVYAGGPGQVELPAAEFEDYLHSIGMQRVVNERTERGESRKAGRESYSRRAKALIGVGQIGAGFDRVVGLDLEIVPEQDPRDYVPGRPLGLRVLEDGVPAAGLLVRAFHPGGRQVAAEGRTDGEGRTRLMLDRPGPWLLSVVSVHRAAGAAGVDWESRWSSLTFRSTAAASR